MAKVQPFTNKIVRTSPQSGNSDFVLRTGVTDLRWLHLGWGPAKKIRVQNPFWLPGLLGVTGNSFDLLVSNAAGQAFIELTPGNTAEFEVDRMEQLWVRRCPDATGLVHTAIDVMAWVNYDPVVNINSFMQYPTQQGGFRLGYEEGKEQFLDDLYKTFQEMYTFRARPRPVQD